MHEAMLWKSLPNNEVQCNVCHHRCIIKDGRRGICAVRENRQGTLYALNYGWTVSAAIDPIEKKPLAHFLPGSKIYSFATVGCNLRCSWCQNWEISQSPKPNKSIQGYEVSPEEHVKRAIEYHCPSIAYTYSEPTVFLEYALETMKLAREKGIKNVWVTNGYMTRETLEIIAPYLDAANVDFKGADDGVYEKYCGAKPAPIMENMKYLCEHGVHLEVTTLVVQGVNDQEKQLNEIAHALVENLGSEVPWHITRFFPAWKMYASPITPIKTMELAKKIAQEAGIHFIHLGNL